MLRDHTQTHHIRKEACRRGINPTQRPLLYNTQHLQQTDIHAAGGIRTRNPSKPAAADLSRRPRGHWDPTRIMDYVKFPNVQQAKTIYL
jgi:hypothetical protein